MLRPKRSRWPLASAVLLLLAAAAVYQGILLRAKLEIGGAEPQPAVTGRVQNLHQRAMQQYCTGLVRTPRNTWLVGRLEDAHDITPQPEGSVQLDTLVYGGKRAAQAPPEDWGTPWNAWHRKPEQTTYVSRLAEDGIFHEVARLNGTGCLLATPDGSTLYLLTDLERPQASEAKPALEQTAVLRSDDQGQSWQWLESGWLPQVNWQAWSMRPQFHGDREVWAWRDFEFGEEQAAPTQGSPSGLFYSPDLGRTVESVAASAPLLKTLDDLRGKAPADADWGDINGRHGRIRAHVVQYGPDQAVLWISQTFMYGPRGGPHLDTSISVSTRAELRRSAGRWDMALPEHMEGFAVTELQANSAGRTIAVLQRDGQPLPQVAEWNSTGRTWVDHGPLPSPFHPLASSSGLRDFRVGDKVLLANTMSSYQVPRWLSPVRDSSISANAVFYSSDWGASWHKLAIDGYLGVLGFEPSTGRVHWAQGNWYNSRDLQIHSYDLEPGGKP